MSGYIGVVPLPQATQTRDVFTATSGQTSFATSGYTPSFLDVWLNGVKLVNGDDFTAINGSDVVLTSGATAGDTVEVLSYSTYEVNAQTYTGGLTVNNDAATVLTVDRATSDGTIVDIKKDGTSVGSVGSKLGYLTVGTGVSGVLFNDDYDRMHPWNLNTNNSSDGTMDLGAPTERWDNLYLSGGVYLGGTGAANLLDDYEEGTWTPSFSWASQSNAPSPATTSFRYVKVGSVVHVMGYAWGNFGTGSGVLKCSNMPFVSGYSYTLVPLWSSNMSSPIGGYISGSSTTLSIALLAGSSGNFSSSDITNAAAEIGIQFSYITTA